MTLYPQNQQTSVTWPEPFESTWQLLGGTYDHDLAPKLPHLGLSDILFMTTRDRGLRQDSTFAKTLEVKQVNVSQSAQ